MPPRLQTPSKTITSILRIRRTATTQRYQRQYATAAATIQSRDPQITAMPPNSLRYPKTQPPSHKPPEFRKTQLLRSYASLLRSTPLMLIFQHNNLKSSEWASIRRELTKALSKVDVEISSISGTPIENLASGVQLQIIQTGIFAAALRVVEYYRPEASLVPDTSGTLKHALSEAAHEAVVQKKRAHALTPLLSGPLVVLSFPTVTPQHLKAALSILAPSTPKFPAPTRRANPGWHEPAVQSGLQKLLLLGARIEGKVFDAEGTKSVGSIDGGLDGLRTQLLHLLQSMGAGVTSTLETAAKSLYFTVESRRSMLEDEGKPKDEVSKAESE